VSLLPHVLSPSLACLLLLHELHRLHPPLHPFHSPLLNSSRHRTAERGPPPRRARLGGRQPYRARAAAVPCEMARTSTQGEPPFLNPLLVPFLGVQLPARTGRKKRTQRGSKWVNFMVQYQDSQR
jgi:hypothetical protein